MEYGVLDKTLSSVKVPTGWSTLELQGLIRPQGYLTKTMTAGRIFSVGGAYLNPSVNGNVINESRYAAQVKSVRTMDSTCSTKVYSGDAVKEWRGSAGLLGIVTAVEIDLVQDSGLTMTRSSISTESFDEVALRAWIENEYTTNDGVEFHWWLFDDILDALEVNFNGGVPLTASTTQAYYDEQIAKNADLAYNGGNAEGLPAFAQLTAGLIETDENLAKLSQRAARDTLNRLFYAQAQMPRDGFYLEADAVTRFNLMASNIPCAPNGDCVDETVEILRISRDFLNEIKDDPYATWYPNLPLEWRVYTVQEDEMLLEHLTPGKYISIELSAVKVTGTYGLSSSRYLMELQKKWRERFQIAIHHSKAYGYENIPGYGKPGDAIQYQNDEVLDSVYSNEVRQAFTAKMQQYDPSGTFAAGSILRLLGMTEDKYTPKQFVGDSCFDYGHDDCIGGCCDKVFFDTINKQCLAAGLRELNEHCSETCECQQGLECKMAPLDWSYKCRE